MGIATGGGWPASLATTRARSKKQASGVGPKRQGHPQCRNSRGEVVGIAYASGRMDNHRNGGGGESKVQVKFNVHTRLVHHFLVIPISGSVSIDEYANNDIGSTSCRERVRQSGSIPVVAVPFKKKNR